MCQGMYEITEHEKQYINQDDALVTVSFQLPRHDWNLLGTSTVWRQFEKLLQKMKTSRERGDVRMDKGNTREEVISLLVDFLRRATRDGASFDEIAVIPQVAKLVLDYSSSETPVL